MTTREALVLHLHGPLQAWGSGARFTIRETDLVPTKSAIIGLLAAALGRPRRSDISDLAALSMVVRVDRRGRELRDYQTVGAAQEKGRRLINAEGKERDAAIVTERYYLADAAFTVGLGGPSAQMRALEEAVRCPRWPLALGRRSCPPAEPFLVGTFTGDPLLVLRDELPVVRVLRQSRPEDQQVRFIADDPAGIERSSRDQPTNELNRWGSYQDRSISIQDVVLPEQRFVKDAFEIVRTLTGGTDHG